jgi:hypothetical protein
MVTWRHLVKSKSTPYDDKRHMEGAMVERTDWEAKARGIIRGEMARQGVTYAQLVERLAAIGVVEDERNLRNKISRGKFTAAFLIQCCYALLLDAIHLR